MNKTKIKQPTLRRRMMIQLGLMVVCSLLIGIGAFVGINGQHDDLGVALQGYRELRQVYEVGFEVATAKDALSANDTDPPKALTAMESALLKLDPTSLDESPSPWLDESKRNECRQPIEEAISQLRNGIAADDAVNDALGKLSSLSAKIRTTIVEHQNAADGKRKATLATIVALSVAVVLVALVVGRRQYQGVVGPLDRVGRGVRNFADGKLSERIADEVDSEFASLAADFNHMADELGTLYRDLQQKVEAKSKELVRSERLASVGYLAAGVAHEINNPLSIITGYGERSLKLLGRGLDETALDKTRKTIRIMCEEAFRCKDITDRLLSLAKPGTGDLRPVSLRDIAGDVIRNVGGLPEYASRGITLESDPEEDFTVVAKDGELKQVIINLLLNSLDAVQPGIGRVNVRLQRKDDAVELSVKDNGRGMSAETVDRVFEPFFTDRRGARSGVGLGLSITHAIVASHGGRIIAESDGIDHGSCFTVQFPAAEKGVAHDIR